MKTLRETPKTKQLELLNSDGAVIQRTCRTCQHVLLVENFYKVGKSNFMPDCKDCFSKKDKAYKQENKDAQKVYKQNHRARQVGAPDKFTLKELTELQKFAGGVCMLTGKATKELEIDHVQAVSKGWLGNTKGNMILVCKEVNQAKSTKSLLKFIEDDKSLIDKKQLKRTLIYLAEANGMDLKSYLNFLERCEELAEINKEYWR